MRQLHRALFSKHPKAELKRSSLLRHSNDGCKLSAVTGSCLHPGVQLSQAGLNLLLQELV